MAVHLQAGIHHGCLTTARRNCSTLTSAEAAALCNRLYPSPSTALMSAPACESCKANRRPKKGCRHGGVNVVVTLWA